MTTTTTAARAYRTVNPTTGEVLREWATIEDSELEIRLARAHQAFMQWRNVPVGEKAALFVKVADLIESRLDDLGRQ